MKILDVNNLRLGFGNNPDVINGISFSLEKGKTLGIVGETLRGPAFEPIFIKNFDEFETYFGGSSPEKFINTQIPKYEAAYIAKSYLQQSNQLFVTRVLGLSGYDAGPSWSITTKANVDGSTVGLYCNSASTVDCVFECVDFEVINFNINFQGCSNNISSVTFNTSQIPQIILNKFSNPLNKLYISLYLTLRFTIGLPA
jgi:hypothetical protein